MSTLKQKSQAILNEKTSKIIPENIKSGVQIFDVLGTYDGGSSSNIKIFETVADMNADPNPQIKDNALVYRNTITDVNENIIFNKCIFPNTVILDEQYNGYSIYGSFTNVNQDDGYYDGSVSLSPSSFSFDGYGSSGNNIRVSYTSNDSITFTRTDGGAELQEIGVYIKWEYGSMDDKIKKFIKINECYFDGIFEYNQYISGSSATKIVPNNISWTNNNIVLNDINNDYDCIFTDNIVKRVTDTLHNDYDYDINGTQILLAFDTTNNIVYMPFWHSSGSTHTTLVYNTASSKLYAVFNMLSVNASTSFLFTYNINTDQLSYEEITDFSNYYNTQIVSQSETNTAHCFDISAYDVVFYNKNYGTTITINCDDYLEGNYSYLYQPQFCENCKSTYLYQIKDTQIDTTSDYVYQKTFYGKNGVEAGTMTNHISKNFKDTMGEIYGKIQAYYDTLTPKVFTAQNRYFPKNITVIPMKSDGTPLYDVSGLTTLDNACSWAKSLISISALDTQNITSFRHAFGHCDKLQSVALMDTHNVTNFDSVFTGCTSLVTVPVFNTSSVVSFSDVFTDCVSLSDQSLNNIMQMCINATQVYSSSKTLKMVGLSQEQVNRCQNLSKWNALIASGWTSGY